MSVKGSWQRKCQVSLDEYKDNWENTFKRGCDHENILNDIVELMGGDEVLAGVWLKTPIPVLDGDTPLSRILAGDLLSVQNIIDEIKSGIVA